jgi:hypothetical protein
MVIPFGIIPLGIIPKGITRILKNNNLKGVFYLKFVGIADAVKEMKLIKEGKKQAKDAEEFLCRSIKI